MSEVSIEAFLVVERSVKCCTSPNYVIPVRVFPGGQFTTISIIVLLHPCVLQAMQSYIYYNADAGKTGVSKQMRYFCSILGCLVERMILSAVFVVCFVFQGRNFAIS